mgnify:CR=1 FL=1
MPTKVNQIKKLRSESKLTQAEIARRVRTSTGYVNNIVKGRKRRPTMKSMSEILAEAQRRAVPVIAAVDAGMTYAEVAKKFGLKSRNVVAGIINRRPEGRAT